MTPLTIAFTSCMDTVNHPDQRGWIQLAKEKPDVVVLLGDSMYMDYGKKFLGAFVSGGPRTEAEANGTPASLPIKAFSDRMHERYMRQYLVRDFKDAISLCKGNVYAIWDDHDFAWNNSRGAGPDGPSRVPSDRRRLSTEHFRTWQRALTEQPTSYPHNVVDPAKPKTDDSGIGRSVRFSEHAVQLHLLDTRTFREGDEDHVSVSMLGQQQRLAIEQQLDAAPTASHVIAVSEPMEKWQNFSEFGWLVDWATRRHILVICGDIHEYHYVGYKANGKKDWGAKDKAVLHEFAASAMAQGPTLFGKKKDVFGTLTFASDSINVRLFHAGDVKEKYTINRQNWKISDQ